MYLYLIIPIFIGSIFIIKKIKDYININYYNNCNYYTYEPDFYDNDNDFFYRHNYYNRQNQYIALS